MAFRFRYEALLSYRGHLKEKAEVEFGAAQRKLGEAREALAASSGDLRELYELMERRLRERMLSDELRSYHEYMAGLKERIALLTRLVAEREDAVRKKREDLLTKAKALRVIERLKEKDVEAWNREQFRVEQKQMNEVAVIRFGREAF